MKITKVIKKGFVDTRKVLKGDYEKCKAEFLKENIVLPDLKNLPFDSWEDVRILLAPLEVVVYTSEGVLRYKFKKGFITDFASVPSFFRSIVDNDSPYVILPAIVHDANFRYHFLSYKESNKLFKKMIRLSGGSWWLSFKAWLGVSTSFGRSAYDKNKPLKDKRVSFEWSDK